MAAVLPELPRVVVATGPTQEPVALEVAKDHLRVSHSADDALIGRLIQVARERVEAYTGLTLATRTVDCYWDVAPTSPVALPVDPVQSLTSVTTYNTAGTGAVMASSGYDLDVTSSPPRLFVDAWPTDLREWNAVVIRLVCGYATLEAIPAVVTQALLLTIAELYERREDASELAVAAVPLSAQTLLAQERRRWGVA